MPEQPIQAIDDLLVEMGNVRIKETIRKVLSPLAAQREFDDLSKDVLDRREESSKKTNKLINEFKVANKMAEALSAGSNVQGVVTTIRVVMTRMGMTVQAVLEELVDMMQEVSCMLLAGLQRRLDHMQNMFYVTAGVVDDRNDIMTAELQPLRQAILDLQQRVAELQEDDSVLKRRLSAAEGALREARGEMNKMNLQNLHGRMMADAARGRSPGQGSWQGSDMPRDGPHSRASSRAQSQERLALAQARRDFPEAVRQAQKLATLRAMDDATHPLGSSAPKLWEEEHNEKFELD